MGRSGYTDDDCDDVGQWLRNCAYTGNVKRHMAGRAGQKFLWELYRALEALPEHALVTEVLVDTDGAYCSLGAVARARQIPIPDELGIAAHDEHGPLLEDTEFYEAASDLLGIHEMMAREVMYENDECDKTHYAEGPALPYRYGPTRPETPEERWQRMREWVVGKLRGVP